MHWHEVACSACHLHSRFSNVFVPPLLLQMRDTVRQVAHLFPTAIISGRGRDKVEAFVQLPELFYAGSHGMDIAGPRVSARAGNGSAMHVLAMDLHPSCGCGRIARQQLEAAYIYFDHASLGCPKRCWCLRVLKHLNYRIGLFRQVATAVGVCSWLGQDASAGWQ